MKLELEHFPDDLPLARAGARTTRQGDALGLVRRRCPQDGPSAVQFEGENGRRIAELDLCHKGTFYGRIFRSVGESGAGCYISPR